MILEKKIDKNQLTIIVITVVTTETVRRLTSFIGDKLKTVIEKEKTRTIFKVLMNKFLIIAILQTTIFVVLLFMLILRVQTDGKVTNSLVFQLIVVYSIFLRCGYNTLGAYSTYFTHTRDYYQMAIANKRSDFDAA